MHTFIKDYNLGFFVFFLKKKNNCILTYTGCISGLAQLSNFSEPSYTLYAHGFSSAVYSGYFIVAINMVLASPFQVRVLLSTWQLKTSTEWKLIPRMVAWTTPKLPQQHGRGLLCTFAKANSHWKQFRHGSSHQTAGATRAQEHIFVFS